MIRAFGSTRQAQAPARKPAVVHKKPNAVPKASAPLAAAAPAVRAPIASTPNASEKCLRASTMSSQDRAHYMQKMSSKRRGCGCGS